MIKKNSTSKPAVAASKSKKTLVKLAIVTEAVPLPDSIITSLQDAGFSIQSLVLIPKVVSASQQTIEDVFSEIAVYSWAFFNSLEAVKTFFACFFQRFQDLRCLGPMQLISNSEAVTEALKQLYLQVDIQNNSIEKIFEEILETTTLENEKVLVVGELPRAQEIATIFEKQGQAIVDIFPVASNMTVDVESHVADSEAFKKEGAHYLLFNDPQAVDAFMRNMKYLTTAHQSLKPKVLSADEATSKKLKSIGIPIYQELKLSKGKLPASLAQSLSRFFEK